MPNILAVLVLLLAFPSVPAAHAEPPVKEVSKSVIPNDFFDRSEEERTKLVTRALLAGEMLHALHFDAKLRNCTDALHALLAKLAGTKLKNADEDVKFKEVLLYEIRDNFPPDSPHLEAIYGAWKAETHPITKDRFLRVFRKLGGQTCQELLDRANGVSSEQRADAKTRAGGSATFETKAGAPLVTAVTVRLDDEGRVLTEWKSTLPEGTVASISVSRLSRPVGTPDEAEDAVDWGSNPRSLPAKGGLLVQSEPAVVDGKPYTPGNYFARLDVYANPHWPQPAELAPFLQKHLDGPAQVEKGDEGDYHLSVPFFFKLPLEP